MGIKLLELWGRVVIFFLPFPMPTWEEGIHGEVPDKTEERKLVFYVPPFATP